MQLARRHALRSAGVLTLALLPWLPLLAPLQAAAQDLPRLVAAARPSIVAIGSFERLRNPQFRFTGTGFSIGDGNTIATCAHVLPALDPATQEQLAMAIPVPGGARVLPLKLSSLDREADLAVLRFEGPPLPALPLSETETAAEGSDVVLIGFPIGAALGLFPAAHRGIVAAIAPMSIPGSQAARLDARSIQRLRGNPFEILQLDATAYPGNSGSPLLDARSGQVIGIVNMVVIKGARESAISAPSGISYAVPVRHLQALTARR